ncbi:hypothetical protein E2C01_041508 [Portunus trituberculatus]|uniref:Uncharacterized protein n=1 Tax=Portunus trituberculatus TaxID=210409 RepID=A0A5B7FK61_PORTR|nr:hypothetical protein [Portunus trituberculatus]
MTWDILDKAGYPFLPVSHLSEYILPQSRHLSPSGAFSSPSPHTCSHAPSPTSLPVPWPSLPTACWCRANQGSDLHNGHNSQSALEKTVLVYTFSAAHCRI